MSVTYHLRELRHSLHLEGIRFTTMRVVAQMARPFGVHFAKQPWFHHWAERTYDRRFRVRTSDSVETPDLELPEDRRADAIEYTPTVGPKFHVILHDLGLDWSRFSFVDIGCGKGKVLTMASDYPFRSITGVELSRQLCETARSNLRSYRSAGQRCFDVRVVEQDATTFALPGDPLLIYMYNPFIGDVMRRVLKSITHSLREQPREAILIYSNPLEASQVKSLPEFEPIPMPGLSVRTWLVGRLTGTKREAATDAQPINTGPLATEVF